VVKHTINGKNLEEVCISLGNYLVREKVDRNPKVIIVFFCLFYLWVSDICNDFNIVSSKRVQKGIAHWDKQQYIVLASNCVLKVWGEIITKGHLLVLWWTEYRFKELISRVRQATKDVVKSEV